MDLTTAHWEMRSGRCDFPDRGIRCRATQIANASALIQPDSPGRLRGVSSHLQSHSVRGTNGSGGDATFLNRDVARDGPDRSSKCWPNRDRMDFTGRCGADNRASSGNRAIGSRVAQIKGSGQTFHA